MTSEEDDPTPVDMDEIKAATFSDPGLLENLSLIFNF